MTLELDPSSPRFWGEIGAWALPALGALLLLRRSPRGARAAWGVVFVACSLIVIDKGVDLLSLVYDEGRRLVGKFDPGNKLRGETLWLRYVVLGGLFAVSCLGLALLVRTDRRIDAAKLLSLSGIVGILGWLAIRLVPSVKDDITVGVSVAVQGGCLAAILLGEAWGWRRTRS